LQKSVSFSARALPYEFEPTKASNKIENNKNKEIKQQQQQRHTQFYCIFIF